MSRISYQRLQRKAFFMFSLIKTSSIQFDLQTDSEFLQMGRSYHPSLVIETHI